MIANSTAFLDINNTITPMMNNSFQDGIFFETNQTKINKLMKDNLSINNTNFNINAVVNISEKMRQLKNSSNNGKFF